MIKFATITAIAVTVFLFSNAAFSAGNDTIRLPVTLYDFKANSSNPDFNNYSCYKAHIDSVCPFIATGMIKETLDKDGKPVLNKNRICNNHIESWYSPSGAAPDASYNNSLHTWTGVEAYKGRAGEFVGSEFDSSDSMANVVIYDSLPFVIYTLIDIDRDGSPDYPEGAYAQGTYIYNNQAFFKVDDRGFVAGGDETALGPFGPRPTGICDSTKADCPDSSEGGFEKHNFSFTMELHRKFIYTGGKFFEFTGDDDVWVFINGKLALDMGGIHPRENGTFMLDAKAEELGLVKGKTYRLDFFYAERMITMSTVKIATNLLKTVPSTDIKKFFPEKELSGITIKTGNRVRNIGLPRKLSFKKLQVSLYALDGRFLKSVL